MPKKVHKKLASAAKKKGLNMYYWAFMGLLCGPFVIMLVLKEPSKK